MMKNLISEQRFYSAMENTNRELLENSETNKMNLNWFHGEKNSNNKLFDNTNNDKRMKISDGTVEEESN